MANELFQVGAWAIAQSKVAALERVEERRFSNKIEPAGVRVHFDAGGSVFVPDPDGKALAEAVGLRVKN
jgi:hypothetical protein